MGLLLCVWAAGAPREEHEQEKRQRTRSNHREALRMRGRIVEWSVGIPTPPDRTDDRNAWVSTRPSAKSVFEFAGARAFRRASAGARSARARLKPRATWKP